MWLYAAPAQKLLLIRTLSLWLHSCWSEKFQAATCCPDSDVVFAHPSDKSTYGTRTAGRKHGDQMSNRGNVCPWRQGIPIGPAPRMATFLPGPTPPLLHACTAPTQKPTLNTRLYPINHEHFCPMTYLQTKYLEIAHPSGVNTGDKTPSCF